jgi:hypothetical protein
MRRSGDVWRSGGAISCDEVRVPRQLLRRLRKQSAQIA